MEGSSAAQGFRGRPEPSREYPGMFTTNSIAAYTLSWSHYQVTGDFCILLPFQFIFLSLSADRSNSFSFFFSDCVSISKRDEWMTFDFLAMKTTSTAERKAEKDRQKEEERAKAQAIEQVHFSSTDGLASFSACKKLR